MNQSTHPTAPTGSALMSIWILNGRAGADSRAASVTETGQRLADAVTKSGQAISKVLAW